MPSPRRKPANKRLISIRVRWKRKQTARTSRDPIGRAFVLCFSTRFRPLPSSAQGNHSSTIMIPRRPFICAARAVLRKCRITRWLRVQVQLPLPSVISARYISTLRVRKPVFAFELSANVLSITQKRPCRLQASPDKALMRPSSGGFRKLVPLFLVKAR